LNCFGLFGSVEGRGWSRVEYGSWKPENLVIWRTGKFGDGIDDLAKSPEHYQATTYYWTSQQLGPSVLAWLGP
jgi:hypothetical protein